MPARKPRDGSEAPTYIVAHQQQAMQSFEEIAEPVATLGQPLTSLGELTPNLRRERLIRIVACLVQHQGAPAYRIAEKFGIAETTVRTMRREMRRVGLLPPVTIARIMNPFAPRESETSKTK